MGAKSGQSGKSKGSFAGRQRLALILFGIAFVGLFVGFAVAQGIGQPSVPSGDVVLVKGVPSDEGTISEAEFDAALRRQATQGGLKKPPKPGEAKYEELQSAAMGELLDQIWIKGQAEEMGISVTDKQIESELATIKKQNFPTKAAYAKFLKESHFTQQDVNDRVELQLLSTAVQEQANGGAPQPSSAEIANYYDAEKAAQFTTKATRDVRAIINEDKAKVEKAKVELEKDNSPKAWKKVAAKYSSDPSTKSKGGLLAGISEEFVKGALKSAIFGSATNELVGPVKYEKKYVLIEVVKLTPAKVQTLAEVKSQISSTLSQQIQQEFFSEFVSDYQSKWTSRTYCASGFEIERCANFRGSGRPANAPPACYEADPKTPATACPAPVTPTSPALPGTVTVVKPKGEPFPQRPQPEAAEAGEAGTTLPEGATAPGGATAPEGAAPEGAAPSGE